MTEEVRIRLQIFIHDGHIVRQPESPLGAKDAAKETEKAIDKVDKKAAEEIRRE